MCLTVCIPCIWRMDDIFKYYFTTNNLNLRPLPKTTQLNSAATPEVIKKISFWGYLCCDSPRVFLWSDAWMTFYSVIYQQHIFLSLSPQNNTIRSSFRPRNHKNRHIWGYLWCVWLWFSAYMAHGWHFLSFPPSHKTHKTSTFSLFFHVFIIFYTWNLMTFNS